MPVADFVSHRNALIERLGDDEAVLLFASPHPLRNGDAEHRYRPDSDVWWLTGWEDAECAVFVRPGPEPVTMFVQKKEVEKEVWTGVRPGPQGAKAHHGADAAFTIDELEEHLPRLLQGVSVLHYAFGRDARHDAMVSKAIGSSMRVSRKSFLPVPETFQSPSRLLHELRLVKGADELGLLREAARITDLAHRRAMALGRPGRNEREIEALIDYTFRSEGGDGPGYGTIVATGKNGCVLHYTKCREPVADGDLVLVDAGCEVGFYTADVTRTWPANGQFTGVQRSVYEHVLDAQKAAIDTVRVGRPFRALHDAAVRRLTEAMVDLGLLKGSVDELIETEKFKKYYMHGTSHWLGLDVHDAGVYSRGSRSRPLGLGMVLTVEPGLYVSPNDEDAPKALRGLAVRIEDDVLVTAGDPDVLTASIPKEIGAVEAACQRISGSIA